MTLHASFPSESSSTVRSEDRARLRFESIGLTHARALEELFRRNAVRSVTSGFDPFPLTAVSARTIAMEPGRDSYFVLADGDLLTGFSMLRGADEGYEVPSFGIFIDQASQGQGLGRLLTTRTLDAAREQGAPAVRLSVYEENRPARRLYESLGFVERERHRVDRNGRASEKIVMRLDFET
jgi:ribosomal protein S18 acetylase RimI-like enzyme